ncbi:MAG: polysaccharide pyruvyl transferase family protein [Armatimonadetes bacterium]|nr:polysaccharide pyruvyl transferase family protein [Armatimonadota bacterium]
MPNQQHELVLKWWKARPNWGDVINPVLFELISGRRAAGQIGERNPRKLPNYMIVGSVLRWADEESVVWGPGFLKAEDRLQSRPKQLCAVRGPLSREIILSQGIDCPEVYGDPALLFPRFYQPDKTAEFRLGIIPHYVDKKHPWIRRMRSREGVLVIDVQRDVYGFLDDVCRCAAIVSSSLHGLVAADTYGVPSLRIELTDRVVGQGFKFQDYYRSVEKEDQSVRVDSETSVESLLSQIRACPIKIDLDKLWNACPFRAKDW